MNLTARKTDIIQDCRKSAEFRRYDATNFFIPRMHAVFLIHVFSIKDLRLVGKHSLPLRLSFDNPKTARCRSPFFNGFSILGYYHFFSMLSQMFNSPSSRAKNLAFSMLGTTFTESPRRNSAFAVVLAMID